MTPRRSLAALAAGTLLLAACADESADPADTAAASADTAEPADANQPTPPASEATGQSTPPATETAEVASDDATDDAAGQETVVVPAALQFSAPLVGGGDIDAAALAGKPTVFWFWAPN